MFGIGLPEMIVILAVALIVVGPDKLPELARSLAKGVQELKNTVNQVKENLNEEGNILDDVHKTVNQVKADLGKDGNILGEVQSELQQTADKIQEQLLEPDPKTLQPSAENTIAAELENQEEVIDLQPLEERPWERDRKQEPEQTIADEESITEAQDEIQPADTVSKTDSNTPPSTA